MLSQQAPTINTEIPYVSKAIIKQMPIGTSSDLFWDGFYAYCEGQPLAAMPTEAQERGWWNANMSQAEAEMPSEYQDDIADRDFWSKGQW